MHLAREPLFQSQQGIFQKAVAQRCNQQSPRERYQECKGIGVARRQSMGQVRVEVVQKVVVDVKAVADQSESPQWLPTQDLAKEAAGMNALQN